MAPGMSTGGLGTGYLLAANSFDSYGRLQSITADSETTTYRYTAGTGDRTLFGHVLDCQNTPLSTKRRQFRLPLWRQWRGQRWH